MLYTLEIYYSTCVQSIGRRICKSFGLSKSIEKQFQIISTVALRMRDSTWKQKKHLSSSEASISGFVSLRSEASRLSP